MFNDVLFVCARPEPRNILRSIAKRRSSLLIAWLTKCIFWLEGLPAGCRLRASRICPIPCAYPLPKSPLRASVKMAFLVARIGVPKDPGVHPFQKWSLRASVFKVIKNQHLDPNITLEFETWGFTTGFEQKSHWVPLSNPYLWGVIQSTRTIPHATWTRTVSAVRAMILMKLFS